MDRRNKNWTEEEEEILAATYAVLPTDIIAKILGRTENAIQCKALAMGINKRFLPKHYANAVRQLYEFIGKEKFYQSVVLSLVEQYRKKKRR